MRHVTQVMTQMPLRHVAPVALCVPPGLVEGVSAHINTNFDLRQTSRN